MKAVDQEHVPDPLDHREKKEDSHKPNDFNVESKLEAKNKFIDGTGKDVQKPEKVIYFKIMLCLYSTQCTVYLGTRYKKV